MSYPTKKQVDRSPAHEDKAVHIAKLEMLSSFSKDCPLSLGLKVYAAIDAAFALAEEMFNEDGALDEKEMEKKSSDYVEAVFNEIITMRMITSALVLPPFHTDLH